MAKNTQLYTLYNLLKAAGDAGVDKKTIADTLGVKESSVAVYIFSMKKQFNAQYECVKQGREVLSYKLLNAADVKVPQHKTPRGKNKVQKAKPITSSDGAVPILDPEVDQGMSDSEFDDIKTSLGIF